VDLDGFADESDDASGLLLIKSRRRSGSSPRADLNPHSGCRTTVSARSQCDARPAPSLCWPSRPRKCSETTATGRSGRTDLDITRPSARDVSAARQDSASGATRMGSFFFMWSHGPHFIGDTMSERLIAIYDGLLRFANRWRLTPTESECGARTRSLLLTRPPVGRRTRGWDPGDESRRAAGQRATDWPSRRFRSAWGIKSRRIAVCYGMLRVANRASTRRLSSERIVALR